MESVEKMMASEEDVSIYDTDTMSTPTAQRRHNNLRIKYISILK